MCQARGVQQEFQCLTRVFQSIERECFTRVCHKSVRQECLTRVSHKSVPQECPTRVPHKSAPQECPTRVPQECHKRVSHTIAREECQVSSESVLQEWLLLRSSISCSLFIVL